MPRSWLILAGLAASLASAVVSAQDRPAPPIALSGRLVIDAVATSGETVERHMLQDAELIASADLDRLLGASGLTLGAHLLATAGARPNDSAGTLQGINNIEVSEHHAKLYEAWLEQALPGGRASLRVGLSDLNADFYQNDSAGLLIAPPFGIGSELAATGPNGPSIFPSTALMARLAVNVPGGYLRVAAIGARAGVLGDPGGIDWRMRDGALLIVEGGRTTRGKLALGAWRYTRRQDDVRALGPDGSPRPRIAQGAYLLVDRPLGGGEARGANLFLRLGISEGRTTPFRGGFQAGVLAWGMVPGRPDAQLSFGLQSGFLAGGFRANLADLGQDSATSEWGMEATYADKLAPFLTVQPDVQYVRRAVATARVRDSWVFGLRLIAAFGGG